MIVGGQEGPQREAVALGRKPALTASQWALPSQQVAPWRQVAARQASAAGMQAVGMASQCTAPVGCALRRDLGSAGSRVAQQMCTSPLCCVLAGFSRHIDSFSRFCLYTYMVDVTLLIKRVNVHL